MNILVVGSELNLAECKLKFGDGHQYEFATSTQVEEKLEKANVIFDFLTDDASHFHHDGKIQAPVFLNATYTSLANLKNEHNVSFLAFGFCGLPSFLNREVLEVSLEDAYQKNELENICKKLNTNFAIVADRAGLVTPRIICMIINEAYYTVQEGTATREDIDLAMKLGTNYPYGPFEWCEKIGIENVYGLLASVYQETNDERYKVCELLQSEFLLHRNTLR